ncbi:MAG TPA: copper chaperone, partial [Paraburkholderia sp.]|nr:copper chaperone [Paraburkholderia sp.]
SGRVAVESAQSAEAIKAAIDEAGYTVTSTVTSTATSIGTSR